MEHEEMIIEALNEWKNEKEFQNIPFEKSIDIIIQRIKKFEYVKDLKFKHALLIVTGQITCSE